MPKLSYLKALNRALGDEMARDPGVFLLGEDVNHALTNTTHGLLDRFGPDRIVETPLSEQGFTNFATGAAMAGMRPVVEFQIPFLLLLVFEQITNQAAKFRQMSGGRVSVPVTYLLPSAGWRPEWGGQHSDQPYGLFAHMGVKTVVPATPTDAYGLLVTAIRDDDPVVFFAPIAALGVREDVDYADLLPVPLGVGRVRRPGTDVTVVAIGHWCTTRWRSPTSWPVRRRWRCSTRAPSTRSTGPGWPSRCAAPAGWLWSTTPTGPAGWPRRSSRPRPRSCRW